MSKYHIIIRCGSSRCYICTLNSKGKYVRVKGVRAPYGLSTAEHIIRQLEKRDARLAERQEAA